VHDEKLGAIGVGTGVGHGDGAAGIFARYGLVGKFVARSPTPITVGIAALDHKALDHSVKDGFVVEVFAGEGNKIIDSDGCIFGI